jgi:putative flippase GtrA
MRAQARLVEKMDRGQIARYVVNGLGATAVHFAMLSFNVKVLGVPSAGLANLGAAAAGITASFLGSRYFVFRSWEEAIPRQAMRFGALYAAIAGLHGLVLFLWSDVGRLDYRAGFVLATGLQVLLSYWGNKRLVFKA